MTTRPQQIPTRIGRYEILERLAIGGMAEVYLACERGPHGLSRLVVVKRILPHLAHHEQMVRMFFQEARLAARINHPNVVQILELGEEAGFPFIAMEYVAGSTLRDLVAEARRQKRSVPVGVAVHLIAQACAGAHAAHELKDDAGKSVGLVHRDLSPHNLIVDPEGHLKVLDFGIAKAADDGDHTRTGVLKGKLRYMSPEQCNQLPLDRRSDVFSLGIVLWELLVGERLFERRTELATMQAISSADVRDPRDYRPEVPGAVAEAVITALAVNREGRFDTADAMRRALVNAANDEGLILSQDASAGFVESVLGARHTARKASVEEALEKSMASVPADTLGTPPRTGSNPTIATASAVGWAGAAGLVVALATVVLAGAAVTVAGILWWRDDGAKAQVVDPYVAPTGEPVVIGLAPVHDPAVMVGEYEPIRRYLEQKLDRPVKVLVASSYGETARMLMDGEVHFAVLPPYVYLTTAAGKDAVEVVAMKLFDDSTGTDGVLLVTETSPFRAAADLRGHTICYTDRNSSTGYLLPRAWLRDEGLDPDADLPGRMTGNHFQSMRDLEAGLCDVAGTYSGAWLAADRAGVQAARMRVLAVTGRTPHDAITAGPATDAALRTTVREALLDLDVERDIGVDRVGEAERITGFVAPDDRRYDDLRRALDVEAQAATPGAPK